MAIDFTKVDDINRHRYRFWYMFPNGQVVENTLAVPAGQMPEATDTLARAAWAESLRLMVGQRAPQDGGRFTNGMARAAAEQASFVVLRPGERG